MRIKIELISKNIFEQKLINRYVIQGFIYSLLKGTEYSWLHEYKGFKFFNFSELFPIERDKIVKKDKKYFLIISSPNKPFIKIIEEKLKELNEIKLANFSFLLDKFKVFDLKLKFPWKTVTPIVLNKGKDIFFYNYKTKEGFKLFTKRIDERIKRFRKEKLKENIDIKNFKEIYDINFLSDEFKIIKILDVYYNFKKGENTFEWLEDLKLNSFEKYKSFYGKEIIFSEPLFTFFKYWKSTAIKVRIKNKGEILYIGSLWKTLDVNRKLNREEKKFYKFLMDTGLGRFNSLGFGFINPIDKKYTHKQ